MGMAIAKELQRRGADVTLISGPTGLNADGLNLIAVETAEEMYEACLNSFQQADIAVMAAAVADFTPMQAAEQKIKKEDENLLLELRQTKDILARIGIAKEKRPGSDWICIRNYG